MERKQYRGSSCVVDEAIGGIERAFFVAAVLCRARVRVRIYSLATEGCRALLFA